VGGQRTKAVAGDVGVTLPSKASKWLRSIRKGQMDCLEGHALSAATKFYSLAF